MSKEQTHFKTWFIFFNSENMEDTNPAAYSFLGVSLHVHGRESLKVKKKQQKNTHTDIYTHDVHKIVNKLILGVWVHKQQQQNWEKNLYRDDS